MKLLIHDWCIPNQARQGIKIKILDKDYLFCNQMLCISDIMIFIQNDTNSLKVVAKTIVPIKCRHKSSGRKTKRQKYGRYRNRRQKLADSFRRNDFPGPLCYIFERRPFQNECLGPVGTLLCYYGEYLKISKGPTKFLPSYDGKDSGHIIPL